MAARVWTCQKVKNKRKCGQKNPLRKQICSKCGKRRPATKRPAHMAILGQMTYDQCVEKWGEKCGICGRGRSATRRLDRDHEHKADGRMRGLLCSRCNRNLPAFVDADWLDKAAAYLRRVG